MVERFIFSMTQLHENFTENLGKKKKHMCVLRSNKTGIDEDSDDNSMSSYWSSIPVFLRLAP